MKLRLYFLEEKAASAGNGGSSKAAEDEAFAKKYVDLQVNGSRVPYSPFDWFLNIS